MAKLPKILLVFTAVDWQLYSRRPMVQALARTASKYGCTVVAVNRPLCLFTSIITKPRRRKELFKSATLIEVGENLYLFSPKYFIHDEISNRVGFLAPLNTYFLRKSYRQLQCRLNIYEPSPIIWYNYPHQGYVTNLFHNSFHIFELYDSLADFKGRESEYAYRLEKNYRNNVGLLLTTSETLYNRHSADYKLSYMFGNGLDREVFRQLTDTETTGYPPIIKIPSPRIGYAGMISDRIDWTLIGNLAALEPNWNFVFVGPLTSEDIRKKLEGLANIHFHDPVTLSDIPSVLKSFDIGILPYRDNTFFRALNPLKFYEMAAAGLPVVSSNIDELKKHPEELVKVVPNNPEIWRDTIVEIIKSGKERSISLGSQIAADFIWDDMIEKLLVRLIHEWLPDSRSNI